MHHAYIRISTDRQDADAQRLGVEKWFETHTLTCNSFTIDTCSGSVPWRLRKLVYLLDACQASDVIVVSELSRIGRSTVDVLDFLRAAVSHQVTIIVVKSNITVDSSITSKILTTVMALAAEIERDFILQRSREGVAKAQANGVHCGRPEGAFGASKCAPHQMEIARLVDKQIPVATIARIIGVHRHTLSRYIARQSTIA